MKRLLALLGVLLLVCGFSFGIYYQGQSDAQIISDLNVQVQSLTPPKFQIQAPTVPWTFPRGIGFLSWARDNHQFYIDRPELLNETSGDLEFNKNIVREYQELINWLETEK